MFLIRKSLNETSEESQFERALCSFSCCYIWGLFWRKLPICGNCSKVATYQEFFNSEIVNSHIFNFERTRNIGSSLNYNLLLVWLGPLLVKLPRTVGDSRGEINLLIDKKEEEKKKVSCTVLRLLMTLSTTLSSLSSTTFMTSWSTTSSTTSARSHSWIQSQSTVSSEQASRYSSSPTHLPLGASDLPSAEGAASPWLTIAKSVTEEQGYNLTKVGANYHFKSLNVLTHEKLRQVLQVVN